MREMETENERKKRESDSSVCSRMKQETARDTGIQMRRLRLRTA